MIKVEIILSRKNMELIIKQEFSDGITGIFGPSGSGKTSLLHAIAGLAVPKLGKIEIGKRTVYHTQKRINIPVEKRNIGYVFQEGRLFPHMSVLKNLTYGLKKKRNNTIQVDEVVDLLNLRHLLHSRPSQLSGGERQRTAIGRSLLSSPDILLLDEPFSALDTQLRQQIIPYIIRIQRSIKIPILIVSHELSDLLKLTSTLCIINNGRCMGYGNYYDLLRKKSLQFLFCKKDLLNAIPMKVGSMLNDERLMQLTSNKDNQVITVKCEQGHEAFSSGDELRIFINANDIALATSKPTNVTIQNQLRGTVINLIIRNAVAQCIIDVGFLLVAEISIESQKRLHIKKGSKVWCLFKSVAVDMAV